MEKDDLKIREKRACLNMLIHTILNLTIEIRKLVNYFNYKDNNNIQENIFKYLMDDNYQYKIVES